MQRVGNKSVVAKNLLVDQRCGICRYYGSNYDGRYKVVSSIERCFVSGINVPRDNTCSRWESIRYY